MADPEQPPVPHFRGASDGHLDLVNISQACVRTGVTRRTIYNWLAIGKVRYVRTAGGNVRIYAEDLFKKGSE